MQSEERAIAEHDSLADTPRLATQKDALQVSSFRATDSAGGDSARSSLRE
jgi:hypothetical protein